MNAFMDVNIWMIVGFLLAAYSVVANDSLQTLGTNIYLIRSALRKWCRCCSFAPSPSSF